MWTGVMLCVGTEKGAGGRLLVNSARCEVRPRYNREALTLVDRVLYFRH